MSAVEVIPLDLCEPAQADLAEQWIGVYAADQRHLFGDAGSPWQLAEIQGFHRSSTRRRRAWAAVEGGRVVGSVELSESLRDNLDSARVWLATHPAHRGQGIGTALLEAAESAGLASGRATFFAESEVPTGGTDTAQDFATRHGYAVAQRMLRSALLLPADLERFGDLERPGDLGRLESPRLGAAGTASGDPAAYLIESVVGIPPEGWFEGLAELQRRMSTDVPLGDLALEEEDWDVDRVRQMLTTLSESGRQMVTSVALDPTGRMVGFTELSVSAGTPGLAYQGSTLVMTEHRGHRLGLRLKAANTLLLVEALPAVESIRTWNADDNTAMLDVNRELGFVVDAEERTWQKRGRRGERQRR